VNRPRAPLRLAGSHGAKGVLPNPGAGGSLDIVPRVDRVLLVGGEYAGPWELPVLGAVPAPAAVLIRPDGYVAWVGVAWVGVAWVGEPGGARLYEALSARFGPPADGPQGGASLG
jgi:3-(3-hydroxy-phenyl)propionate hydroxylase